MPAEAQPAAAAIGAASGIGTKEPEHLLRAPEKPGLALCGRFRLPMPIPGIVRSPFRAVAREEQVYGFVDGQFGGEGSHVRPFLRLLGDWGAFSHAPANPARSTGAGCDGYAGA